MDISVAERKFILAGAACRAREDGRGPMDYRFCALVAGGRRRPLIITSRTLLVACTLSPIALHSLMYPQAHYVGDGCVPSGAWLGTRARWAKRDGRDSCCAGGAQLATAPSLGRLLPAEPAILQAEIAAPTAERPDCGILETQAHVRSVTDFDSDARMVDAASATLTAALERYMRPSQRRRGCADASAVRRVLLESGALDLRSLTVMPGKYCWRLLLDVMVLADDGNILDCAALAAACALGRARCVRGSRVLRWHWRRNHLLTPQRPSLPRVRVAAADVRTDTEIAAAGESKGRREAELEVDDDPEHADPVACGGIPLAVTFGQVRWLLAAHSGAVRSAIDMTCLALSWVTVLWWMRARQRSSAWAPC